MTFESKYNVGQVVWVMKDNKPTPRYIQVVIATCVTCNGKYDIRYSLPGMLDLPQHRVFETKEDLLKSL